MNWKVVKLIFRREVRDQLRDRRTLFMIFVLPVLLYPALGLGMLQLTLRFGKQTRTIGVVGAEGLPQTPPLLAPDKKQFSPTLYAENQSVTQFTAVVDSELTQKDVLSRRVDSILVLPKNIGQVLNSGGQATIRIIYNGTVEESDFAYRATLQLLRAWQRQIVDARIASLGRPSSFADPIRIDEEGGDVSTVQQRSGLAWGKVIPFILVMMALTGAFYPAVDLCAGEKERGTMETLLITPAARSEIVLGKFLTVFSFSAATTIFNLASMGLTFAQIAEMIPTRMPTAAHFTPPSWIAVVWMLILMLPLAGLFSAVCMALSIFARSTKEGQYYLMPMFLVVTPLIFLTLAPGVELNTFHSLIPITNVALLLRTLMLNEYQKAFIYLIPVMAPTILYAYLALRWAVDQFHREEVLFREAEPFDVRLWVRHLLRDKEPRPTSGEAWFCYILMLMLLWYSQGRLSPNLTSVAITQLAVVAFPAILLTLILTTSPVQTLSLKLPRSWQATLIALGLVITVHPVAMAWGEALEKSLSQNEDLGWAMEKMLGGASLTTRLLIMAVLPAACEELAFRGFILTGLLRKHPPARAILVSGVLFGIFHMVPHQMVVASLLGVILGLVASRTGSVFPGMIFHGCHNSLAILRSHWAGEESGRAIGYGFGWTTAGALASALLVGYLAMKPNRLPERRSKSRD